MNITHLVSNLDDKYGGPSKSVPSISAYQNKHDATIIYCKTLENEKNELVEKYSIKTIGLKTEFKHNIYYSREIESALESTNPTIVHIHSIWRYPAYATYKWCIKNKIPYVCSIRSNLYPESLSKNKIVKNIAGLLFVKKMLANASWIHATDEREVKAIRAYGLNNPIALIPNGINYELLEYTQKKSYKKNKTTFLFMSRIHKRKGIENLIEAWSEFTRENPDCDLIIAGSAEKKEYELKLISMTHKINTVRFVGHVNGADKVKTLKESDIFILPSAFENFGISIGEALYSGLPVITTKKTPWTHIHENAGYIIDNNSKESIINGLNEMKRRFEKNHSAMIENSHNIALEYEWKKISEKFNDAYNWSANKKHELKSLSFL